MLGSNGQLPEKIHSCLDFPHKLSRLCSQGRQNFQRPQKVFSKVFSVALFRNYVKRI